MCHTHCSGFQAKFLSLRHLLFHTLSSRSSSFRDLMRRKRACSRRLARHAVCSFEMSTSSYCCASQSHMLPDLHALVCSKVQCSLASRFNNGQTWKLATCNRVQGQKQAASEALPSQPLEASETSAERQLTAEGRLKYPQFQCQRRPMTSHPFQGI